MPRKLTTPKEITELLAMRSVGYSVPAIADRLNLSIRTVQRHIAAHGVSKGSIKHELIAKARDELLALVNADDTIRLAAARAIADDMAQANRVRALLIEASEYLNPKNIEEAALTLRALAAYSTALKNTSDMLRHSLNLERLSQDQSDMPELLVRTITSEDIEAIKSANFVDELEMKTIDEGEIIDV